MSLLEYTKEAETSTSPVNAYCFRPDYPAFLRGDQLAAYFLAYAKHFDLLQYCRFNTQVTQITRNQADDGWSVALLEGKNATTEGFDRVVVATGCETIPNWPRIKDMHRYGGEVLHSKSFRE